MGIFGSVAMVGLTGEFSDMWQGKDLGNRNVEEVGISTQRSQKGAEQEIGRRQLAANTRENSTL
jgi:hypothetical protein